MSWNLLLFVLQERVSWYLGLLCWGSWYLGSGGAGIWGFCAAGAGELVSGAFVLQERGSWYLGSGGAGIWGFCAAGAGELESGAFVLQERGSWNVGLSMLQGAEIGHVSWPCQSHSTWFDQAHSPTESLEARSPASPGRAGTHQWPLPGHTSRWHRPSSSDQTCTDGFPWLNF